MNKKTTTLAIVVIIAGLLALIIWGSLQKNSSKSDSPSPHASLVPNTTGQPILFYGNTCPYCEVVENWLEETQFEQQVSLVKKEIYDDSDNMQEFLEVARGCALASKETGVPLVYTPDLQCLIGPAAITEYLGQYLEVQGGAVEFTETGEPTGITEPTDDNPAGGQNPSSGDTSGAPEIAEPAQPVVAGE